jgi:hypothetical protein
MDHSGRHRGAASADKGEMKTATLAFDDGATTIDLHAADEREGCRLHLAFVR